MAVGLYAKQKVVAEAGPRVLGGVTVYHLAERYVGSVCRACGVAGGLVVDNRTFNTPYYNIACACCAVVIKIIVPVDTVLGTVVLVDGLQQGELLFSVQVELLLQNAAAHTLISGTELLEGLYAYLIVGQSEHEPKHEVWLAKGEHAVVDGEVCTHSSIGAMVLYAALQGAKDIIAEMVSESEESRNQIRGEFRRGAIITSKVVAKKKDEEEAQRFSDYFDFSEPLKRCSSHRLLAMRRGEAAGFLRISISADDEQCQSKLKRHYVHGYGECQTLVGEAVDDAFKRLLKPSIETEFAALSKQKADEEAIVVFAENLRQLLLAAPLGQKRVMAVDPGFANGCKTCCLDAQGNLIHHEIVYPHPPRNKKNEATSAILRMVKMYQVEAMAVGNGTASRETSDWLHEISYPHPVDIYVVSEDGASIYSASKIARDEFPDEDVTVRGAVSIGRRLMDPLAELVKIDPKSIGVGQYQHDVDQTQLKKSLDTVVMSCVNSVGVNLNTASQHLLTYVSGLGPTLAKNIVEYRKENGAFASRAQLKKVPRLGPSAFEQCAGFLRIPGARNPLDNSAVHPERYALVEQMAKDQGVTVKQLVEDKDLQKKIDIKKYVTAEVGMPTLMDIMAELDKPGLDPRGEVEKFEFDASIKTIEDLQEGMVVPGIVTNITKFGAFVDIGVHNDGLVHVSQMSNRYISDPSEVVKLHEHVMVRVTEVDLKRKRIALSMKGVK